MINYRPVVYIIGLLVAVMGVTMVPSAIVDIVHDDDEWQSFFISALITILTGSFAALSCAADRDEPINIKQSFLITVGVWIALPLFGTLPFMIGSLDLSLTDALFESMSGMTTTGSTVIAGLGHKSGGILLWRSILQWLGGLGIVIVALVFLPAMRVGGMQFFRSEGFDTLGKSLPRTLDIAKGLLNIYIGLTVLCVFAYFLTGMNVFDAICHALTTISTGGFSTTDDSFSRFSGGAQYVAILFMILASLPFVRFIQLLNKDPEPLLNDVQVRGYLLWTVIAIGIILIYRMATFGEFSEAIFRETAFNVVSIFSGTGYGDGDVLAWGPLGFAVLFTVGMIGGCSGATSCSLKVFRMQVMFKTIATHVRRLHSPHRVVPLRYDNRSVAPEILNSIMLLVTVFMFSLGVLIVLLGMTGLSFFAAFTGAWTAIFNIGPAFGPEVGASGALNGFPESAKWLMTAGMLLGRLEIVAVIVVFLPRFWVR